MTIKIVKATHTFSLNYFWRERSTSYKSMYQNILQGKGLEKNNLIPSIPLRLALVL